MGHDASRRRMVLEPIEVEPGRFSATGMARGEPGLPPRFVWRGRACTIRALLGTTRVTGPMRGGGRERYVRRHAYDVLLESGEEARLVAERGGASRRRWWLHSLVPPATQS